MTALEDEAVGKPGGAGVDTHQRLNLSKPWEGPRRICQGFKPYSGNPTVRHYRGASGNVRHGETVTPSRNRKSENGNPSPTAGRARILSRPRERTLGLTNLVWGDFCQGGAQRVLSIFSCLRVSLFDLTARFFVPTHDRVEPARAEAVKDGRVAPPARAWSLTGSSTTAHLLWLG
jgi:hypothetical protein